MEPTSRLQVKFITGLCIVILVACSLCMEADAQLSSDWISEDSDSYSLESDSLGLGIESGEEQSCDASMGECGLADEGEMESGHGRQLRRRKRGYISYRSLGANQVLCRPRSGRPYYSKNCGTASGRVNPYRRACNVITRCYRWTG